MVDKSENQCLVVQAVPAKGRMLKGVQDDGVGVAKTSTGGYIVTLGNRRSPPVFRIELESLHAFRVFAGEIWTIYKNAQIAEDLSDALRVKRNDLERKQLELADELRQAESDLRLHPQCLGSTAEPGA
jgi:hypothetical protein